MLLCRRRCLLTEPKKPPAALRKLKELTRGMPDDADYDAAQEEMTKGSDRVSALLATAWLDMHLEQTLREWFDYDYPKDDETIFSQDGAPLRPFGAKINMALALGVIGAQTRLALLQIAKIRNVFAHSAHNVTFDTPEIKLACENIPDMRQPYAVSMEFKIHQPTNETVREFFIDISMWIMVALLRQENWRLEQKADKAKLNSDISQKEMEIIQTGNLLYKAILQSQLDALMVKRADEAPKIP